MNIPIAREDIPPSGSNGPIPVNNEDIQNQPNPSGYRLVN